MSIDKLGFSPALIRTLYKDEWMVPLQHVADHALETAVDWRWLGNHKKKVTLVVDQPGHSFLPEEELAFLVKIFEACRMNLDDIAIVNIAAKGIGFEEIQKRLAPKSVLFFGLEPTAVRLPFQIPLFKPQDYNHCRFICFLALSALNQDTAEGKLLKTKLWLCLKELFGI